MEFPLIWVVIFLLLILVIILVIIFIPSNNSLTLSIEKGLSKTITIESGNKIYILYNGVKTLLQPSVNKFDTFTAILSPKSVDIIQVKENNIIKIIVE